MKKPENKPLLTENKALKLQLKHTFGRELVYPACETSKKLAKLTKTKTFSKDNLTIFIELGFKIEWVPGFLEL